MKYTNKHRQALHVQRMKYLIGITLLLSSLLLFATSFAIPPPEYLEKGGFYSHSRHSQNWQRLYHELDADTVHSFDALDLDIAIHPNLETRTAHSEVTMRFRVMEDNLQEIELHLADCTINSITMGDVPLPMQYTQDGENLTINLGAPQNLHDTLTVTINYELIILNNNYFGGLIYRHQQNTMYTFGEPYETRFWLACYDRPFDKVTSTMRVTMASEYIVVSNGELVGIEDAGNGESTTTWQNSDPISTYLISIAASPYAIINFAPAGVNNTPLSVYSFPADSATSVFEFGRTGEMLELFESHFGAYPFNKYAQVLAPIFDGWGAMEHQTCTTYGAALVRLGNRQAEQIVAHELAHQWWGDMVGPFTFAEIWLNEGFATYSAGLWLEHLDEHQFEEYMYNGMMSYFNEDADPDRGRFPIFNPPYIRDGWDPMFSSTVYRKGAWILHMLRWVVGDEDFFAGLRAYGETFAYGNAKTHEFKEVMEAVSEQDLSSFFDEWVFDQGYPIFSFENLQSVPNDSGSRVSFELVQTQTDAPFFTTPLPVLLTNGEQEALIRLENIQGVESQIIELGQLPFTATSLEFDPDHWILSGNHASFAPEDIQLSLPESMTLLPAYPNPFNSGTNFIISLPHSSWLEVVVYNHLGQQVDLVTNRYFQSGSHLVKWKPERSVANGMYYIRASSNTTNSSRSVILLK
ncbi:T9SS type A sorting domain-containing protein [bacterium]|nr:T9SS type A sorting domain-containing protein [bacterium]